MVQVCLKRNVGADQSDMMLECMNCGITVHESCYGKRGATHFFEFVCFSCQCSSNPSHPAFVSHVVLPTHHARFHVTHDFVKECDLQKQHALLFIRSQPLPSSNLLSLLSLLLPPPLRRRKWLHRARAVLLLRWKTGPDAPYHTPSRPLSMRSPLSASLRACVVRDREPRR